MTDDEGDDMTDREQRDVAPTPCPACRRGDHGGCWTHDPTRQGGGATALRCPCAHPSTPADREAVGALADAIREVRERLDVTGGIAVVSRLTEEEMWAKALAGVLSRDGWAIVPYVDAEVVEDDDAPVTGSMSLVGRLRSWAPVVRDGRLTDEGRRRAAHLIRDAADVLQMMDEEIVHLRDTVDEQHADLRAAVRHADAVPELLEAIRLTQEHAQLPAIEGWSWWDVYRKHRPADAERLRSGWQRHRDARPQAPRETVLVLQESHGAVGERPMWFAVPHGDVTVVLSHREWDDLGRPDTITVAVWPGYRAVEDGDGAPDDDTVDVTDDDYPPDPSQVPLTDRLRRYAEVVGREAVSPMVTGRPLAETLVEAAGVIDLLTRVGGAR